MREFKDAARKKLMKAIEENAEYLGHRWLKLDKDSEDDTIQELGTPTSVCKKMRSQTYMIAVMTPDKTAITNVFATMTEIANHFSTCPSNVSLLLHGTGRLQGNWISKWEDCPNNLREIYLRTHTLPSKPRVNANSQAVNQLNEETGELIKSYGTYTDIVKEYKCSYTTIKKAIKTKTSFRGFKWELSQPELQPSAELQTAVDETELMAM
jgi:hypothetical protein